MIGSVILTGCSQIGLDTGVFEQALNVFSRRKALIMHKAKIGRELHINHAPQLAAQEFGHSIKRLDHSRGIETAERLYKTDGVPQVRGHAHLGNGHNRIGQHRIKEGFLAHDLDKGVTDKLAGAQLALAWAGRLGRAPALMGWFHQLLLSLSADRTRIKAQSVGMIQNGRGF
jgi:hypothetical protein